MRYYRIEIANKLSADAGFDDKGQPIVFKDVGKTLLYVYSSHLENGQMNPGALNVVFNLATSYFHNSANVGSFVQIQGLPLDFLSQAYKLRGKHIRIFGGMTKDYIVDEDKYGLLINGVIVAPAGNWEGTNQTLSFYMLPSEYVDQRFISMSWDKGQMLSDALKSALTVSFPEKKIEVSVKPANDIKALKKQGAIGQNIETFAMDLYRQKNVYNTAPINIYAHNDTIYVTDSPNGKKVQLETKYMIGQPTWSDNNNITVSMILRPDINVNDVIIFPKESSYYGVAKPLNQSADYYINRGTNANIKNKPIFQGEYLVLSVQHIANYKSPSPHEWITFLTLSTMKPEDNVDVKQQ